MSSIARRLGTHERFTAFLIEHYAGAFPVWLAPIQARVIPISEKVGDYAQKVVDALFAAPVVNGTAGLRVDIDTSNERMQKKIRDAQLAKIPYMLVVGEREAQEGKVAVRLRSGKDLGAVPLESFHRPHQTRGGIPRGCGRIALFRSPFPPILRPSPARLPDAPLRRASRKAPVCVHDRTSFRLAPTDQRSVVAHGYTKERSHSSQTFSAERTRRPPRMARASTTKSLPAPSS